jgi:hypothetical protein
MFGISDYGAFVAAFVLLLFLPGPGNLALITSTSQGGMKGGFASVMGLILGDQILLWMTVAGVAALLQTYPHLFLALQWVGAAYLAWLGFKMVIAKPGEGPLHQNYPWKVFQRNDVHHLAQSQGHHVLFCVFSSIHRSRTPRRNGNFCFHGIYHCRIGISLLFWCGTYHTQHGGTHSSQSQVFWPSSKSCRLVLDWFWN